ncbi:MAG: TIGR03621 family F420-dependent LLM class oxidoreductase [Acidimicrobiales bacterium]
MPHAKPFRFGVQAKRAADGRAWRDQARAVEALGYSTLWVPDHLGDQWGPLVGLTAAAAATSTLRVGALVFDNDFRHPAVLAKELATLDLVSDGRLEAGIGAGWLRTDYEAHGLAYDAPGTRIERMAEAVAVMKALWSDDGPTSFAGRHYILRDAPGRPAPVQRPHPPVLVGGGGRRVLSVAAREADIVGFNANLAAGVVGPEVAGTALASCFDDRVAWVRSEAGDRFDALELHCNVFVCMVGADPRASAEALAPAFGVSATDALDVPLVIVGSVDHICDLLQQRRERFGFTYWVVPAASAEAFAPVVARLSGR